jgi:lincosamide and streptogramin A transport system ATP-binding/permease protein
LHAKLVCPTGQAFCLRQAKGRVFLTTISLNNLSFSYPGQDPLFEHLTLSWDSSWRLGLLGRNGRGKTTLLNIIQSKIGPQHCVQAKLPFSSFPLTIDNKDQLAWCALNTNLPQWQVERGLEQLGCSPDLLWQPYNTLSGGEQTKVQLACVFADKDAFVLLDEPTNHLDQTSRQQLAVYLRHKEQGFIVTSHDETFLDQVIDHVLAIEKTGVVIETGNCSSYLGQKKRRDQAAFRSNAKLKKEIRHLKSAQQQRQSWAQRAEGEVKKNPHGDKGFISHKAAKMMKKSTVMAKRADAAIADRQGQLQNIEEVVPLTINYQPDHHELLLQAKKVSLAVDDQVLFQNLNLTVKKGQQVALVGPNGSGKSSFLKAVLGIFPGKMSGQLKLPQVKISVVRQNYDDLSGSLIAFAKQNGLAYNELINMLHKLGLERSALATPLEKMSQGQRKKAELARSLLTPAQLYVWDEPLNYLDAYNQDQLLDLIQKIKPTMLLVEHDRRFIEAVADETIHLG